MNKVGRNNRARKTQPRSTTKAVADAPKKNEHDQYYSRAVAKAFQSLDYIRGNGQLPTLSQLAAALDLTKASALRILHTLEVLGYVTKSEDGRYSTTGKDEANASARVVQQLIRCASDHLRNLNLESRETVSLAALFESHIEVIMVMESPQLIRMGNAPGNILPPHASSLGKAITAFQPPAVLEKLVRNYSIVRFTPTTITDEFAVREEFARTRAQGFAEDKEESTPGGCCFGAPILGLNGYSIGAVSLSLPKIRLKDAAKRSEIIDSVRATAARITEQIQQS